MGEGLDPGAAIYRSCDGSAFMAFVGPRGCATWGNGWVPCTHLTGAARQVENGGGRIVFLIGTLDELRPHLQWP